MELEIKRCLAEIVHQLPSSALLFEKYDLDYCCHGERTIEEACEGDLEKCRKVEHSLMQLFESKSTKENIVHFDNMNLDDLVEHILNKHHRYLKETMPVIHTHLKKVSGKHGDKHPELKEIFELFAEFFSEMKEYMYKEEQYLFPGIKMLNESFKAGKRSYVPGHFLVSGPIRMMETEHEKAGSILRVIRELTNHFKPPAEACTTYRLCFNELKELEYDLHQHVHLENNVLFPRALKMQKKLQTILSN